jgi:hypothetical protein
MKTVQADKWRQANYPTQKDEADQACKIIVEMDALWRMSYGYGVGLESRGDTSMRDDGYIIVASPSSRKSC